MIHRCPIIGVLDNGTDGLTPQALGRLREADFIVGGGRTLALFKDVFKPDCETRDLGGLLVQVPDWIRAAQAQGKRCAVLCHNTIVWRC